ncbi:hypothetical protein [Phormidesmis priestleyi]
MLEQLEPSLTETQWQTAHAIAQTQTDVNEFKKAIAYLRNSINQSQADAGVKFFKYLKTLVSNGKQIGHSGKTLDYYRNIDQVCSKYLSGYRDDAVTMLQILGWASRLMRYYKEAGPIGEVATIPAPPVASARQVAIAKVAQFQNFKVDQTVEAKITKISGNKVTYEILEMIKLTEKEPKKASSLTEGQISKVKIVALKDDGSIKSVKCAE